MEKSTTKNGDAKPAKAKRTRKKKVSAPAAEPEKQADAAAVEPGEAKEMTAAEKKKLVQRMKHSGFSQKFTIKSVDFSPRMVKSYWKKVQF